MKNIAVIAGGNSAEYGVSIKSGNYVYSEVDESRYNKYLVIVKGRDWLVQVGDESFPVDKNDFSFTRAGEKIVFDFAYITIHGNPGENGWLQGYLDMLGVPYAGCNVLTSALTFDKHTCSTYLQAFGVNVAKAVLLIKGNSYTEEEIVTEVGIPCFVKPNAEGSSYGVSRVNRAEDLSAAIQKAFEYCDEILIESFIEGKELTCGVVKSGKTEWILPIAEVRPKHEFFDFEAKYVANLCDELIPAPIPDALTERIKTLSSLIYDILRCRGIIRIDYIVRGDEIFMLEVNTTPGMTSNSFVPKMLQAMGVRLREVLTMLIEQVG